MTKPAIKFESQDDDAFRTLASELVSLDAPKMRGISVAEYLANARRVWASCEKDAVYTVKLMFDPLVQPQFQEESESEVFCVLVARVGIHGELIDAPDNYTPPNFPNVKLSHIVAGAPSGGHEPDPSLPARYLFAFLDVLGFEELLKNIGLTQLHERYLELLREALRPQSEVRPWSRSQSLVRGEVVPALMWLPIHAAHFSDSLLLWVHYHPGHVGEFLSRCSHVFCKALELGIPLRGAITIGEAVFDKAQNIYLGTPLVEAARLESKQEWVGVSLGASFKSDCQPTPIPPETVLPYTPPLKLGGAELFSALVLDWPRVWRKNYSSSAVDRLFSLSTPELPESLRERYASAAAFYSFSTANENWCAHANASEVVVQPINPPDAAR